MCKKVIISLKGTQNMTSDDAFETELVTEGTFYKKGNAYYVTYNESEITGMEGTTTTLEISDGKVTLMRFGSVNSQMVFEKGQKHLSYYETVYGAFTIGISTHKVDIDIGDSGGTVSVIYNVEIDNNHSAENDFHMLIREAGRTNDEYDGTSQEPNPDNHPECN